MMISPSHIPPRSLARLRLHGPSKQPSQFTAHTLAVVLASVSVLGCTTFHSPKACPPMIVERIDGVGTDWWRNGNRHSWSFGKGLADATNGHTEAQDYAKSYNNLTIAGVVLGAAGALAGTSGAIIALNPDLDNHDAIGGSLAITGVGLAVTSLVLLSFANRYRIDAINSFNDSVQCPYPPPPPIIPPPIIPPPLPNEPPEVNFSLDCPAVGKAERRKIVDFTTKHDKGKVVYVVGHADASGTADRNERLASKRARNIRTILIDQGITVAETYQCADRLPLIKDPPGTKNPENRRSQVLLSLPPEISSSCKKVEDSPPADSKDFPCEDQERP